ncbi:hypothetical protein T492DRAFT_891047 [Pavlovales sp. CCMP2436]|nr:hypothetical protein T492DRAFT_891047 [Pavlovales sp. CCMP2436]
MAAWLRLLAPLALLTTTSCLLDEDELELEPSMLRGWHSSVRDVAGRQYDYVSPHAQHAATRQPAVAQPVAPRRPDSGGAGVPRLKVVTLERGAEQMHLLDERTEAAAGDGAEEEEEEEEHSLLEALSAALGQEQATALLAAAGVRIPAQAQLPELQPGVALSAVLSKISDSLGGRREPPSGGKGPSPLPRPVSTGELMRRMAGNPLYDGEPGVATVGGGGLGTAQGTPPPAAARASAEAAEAPPRRVRGGSRDFANGLRALGVEAVGALETELRAQRDALDHKLRALKERRRELAADARPGLRAAGGGEMGKELGLLLRSLLDSDDDDDDDDDEDDEPKAGLFAQLTASLAKDILRGARPAGGPLVESAARRRDAQRGAGGEDEDEE